MADVRDAGRQVAGEVAHDSPSVGKPVFIGGYASATTPTAVSANGDIVQAWLTRTGAINAANAFLTSTGTLVSSGDTVEIDCLGYGTIGILLEGAFSATVQFQAILDGNWSNYTPVLGRATDSGTIVVSASSSGVFQVNCSGYQKFRVNRLTVGSGTANVTLFAIATALDSVPANMTLADNINAPTYVPITGAFNLCWDGAQWDRLPGTSTDGLLVNLGTNNDVIVTNAGTFVVQENGAALTALQLIDNVVNVVDGALGATPTGILALAIRDDALSALTPVEGDAIGLRVDANGGLWVTISGTVTVAAHAVTNAGTFAVQVDGAALTALQLIDDTVTVLGTDTYTEASSKGITIGAVRRDADTTLVGTTNEFGPLQMDANGRLKVEIFDSGDSHTIDGTVAATQSGTWSVTIGAGSVNIGDVDVLTVPADPFGLNADAASATGSISAKLRFIATTGIPITGTVTVAAHAVTNAGTFAVQESGAALTALQLIDDTVFSDDAGFTAGTSKVHGVGFLADEASIDSVDENDIGAARMTLDRKQIVTIQPHTAGGWDVYKTLDLDETEEDVKTSAGKLGGWYIYNNAATTRYIKFYNATAASVVVGTTTPVMTIPIPAGSAANVEFVNGITFSTAICIAATTGVADADTGAPAANDVVMCVFYK